MKIALPLPQVGRASSRLRGDEAAPAAQARAGSSIASPHPYSRYFQVNRDRTFNARRSTVDFVGSAKLSVEAARWTLSVARCRALRCWAVWLVLFCVYFAATMPASAQVSKEYQVKAVCLWRLAQFVTWPTNAFENANSPIVIAVLGENPFGDLLEAAVRDETAHGRRLAVQHYRNVSDIKSCHILFVSASEAGQVNRVLIELAGRSILTVADFEDFARSKGGMVCFVNRQNKVKLQINLKTVTAARLGLDPRLLRAADIIESE